MFLVFLFISLFFYQFLQVTFLSATDFDFLIQNGVGPYSNYVYREFFGSNMAEVGFFLYAYSPFVVVLSGLILFFALIAAVFLTFNI